MSDLFDREKEIGEFTDALASPLVVVFGLRRMGKTSLVRAVLNDRGVHHVFLDMRKFEGKGYIVYRDFVGAVEHELNSRMGKLKGLEDHLKRIRGVGVAGFHVSFSWSSKNRVEFVDVLEALNNWAQERGQTLSVVIDEAQELVKLKGFDLLPSLAYAYDNLRNLNFIITGSQVRVFTRFLKLEDMDSPLYGRATLRVQLNPFDENSSEEFLRRGFREHGIEFGNTSEAYHELGGNPGWLTHYGYIAVKRGFGFSIDETKKIAKSVLTRELCSFLKEGRLIAKPRYLRILEACINGASWKQIKTSLEALEGREINDAVVDSLITTLIDYSFIVKSQGEYVLADRLLGTAIKGFRCA